MDTKRLAAGVVFAVAAATLPLWAGDQYPLHPATLIAAHWVLIGGPAPVVGSTGPPPYRHGAPQ